MPEYELRFKCAGSDESGDWEVCFRKQIMSDFLPPIGTVIDLGYADFGGGRLHRLPIYHVTEILLDIETEEYTLIANLLRNPRDFLNMRMNKSEFVTSMNIRGFDDVG